jgi:uncharacterized membrane protein
VENIRRMAKKDQKKRDIILSQDNALTTARYKFDLIAMVVSGVFLFCLLSCPFSIAVNAIFCYKGSYKFYYCNLLHVL